MEVLRHLDAVVGAFLEHCNDAHHRVSQAALASLAAFIECFAEHFEGYLTRLIPNVFLKISDAKESTRDAAVAVLEAIRAAYGSEVLLPVLMKTLENSHAKVRLGCVDFLHYLLQHCEHSVRPFFESGTQMKGCVSRLTPLVVDRNASLRKLSAKSCAPQPLTPEECCYDADSVSVRRQAGGAAPDQHAELPRRNGLAAALAADQRQEVDGHARRRPRR